MGCRVSREGPSSAGGAVRSRGGLSEPPARLHRRHRPVRRDERGADRAGALRRPIPDAVLDTIVESARRLCRCEAAAIMLIEEDHFVAGLVGRLLERVRQPCQPSTPSAGPGVAARQGGRRSEDPAGPGRPRRTRSTDGRTSSGSCGSARPMAAPMLLDDEVVGAISLVRTEVDPFDDRELALLERIRRAGRRSSCATCTSCASSRSAGRSSGARSSSSRRSARSGGSSARASCSTRCSRTSS